MLPDTKTPILKLAPEKDLDQGQTFLRIEQWSYGRAAMQNSATQYLELRRLRLFQCPLWVKIRLPATSASRREPPPILTKAAPPR
jgi:hypothetical protein